MKQACLRGVLRIAPLLFLAPAGCLRVLNAGYQDSGPQASNTAGSRTAGSGTAGGTGSGTGSRQGSSSGAGSSSGTAFSSSAGSIGGSSTGIAFGSSAGATGVTTGTTGGGSSTGAVGGCLVSGDGCGAGTDCCSGSCNGVCLDSIGEACILPEDCSTDLCMNRLCVCASEDYGTCATDSDCCGTLACAANFQEVSVSGAAVLIDGGATCCSPSDSGCVDGGFCCSGICNNGNCACASTGQSCATDQGCCAGGQCTAVAQSDTLIPACCQSNGETCASSADCCSNSCENGACACEPSGGLCGGQQDGGFAPVGDQVCCSGACEDAGVCL